MTDHNLRCPEEPEALKLTEHPRVTHRFEKNLQKRITSENLLTDVQAKSVLLGLQALSQTPHAFFLGHGPGVGKTRILAAMAKQHLLEHDSPKILWLVPNSALKKQAQSEMALFGVEKDSCRLASYAQIRADASVARGTLLILDEAHLIRNACPTSDKVNFLQDYFEAIIYSTATAASNVARLSYMKRLGLWGGGTSFETFQEFSKAMKRWGPAASEMLALDLKQRGLYTCFKLPIVPLQHLEITPTTTSRKIFDDACAIWKKRSMPDKFSFMQRLVTSLKAQLLIPRWQTDLAEDYAVVIVLQGTGAAAIEEGTSMMQRICVRNGLRAPSSLPGDALEVIREGLFPESVAEISGRPVAARQAKGLNAEETEEADVIGGNSKELLAFQEGRRRVLAMTAAGTLGLNVTSPWPIRMYILEFPWTPECLAQQLGRCNRLNSGAPNYFVVSLKTIIEKRVEASLAARSETLGALSCADRTAGAVKSLPWGRKLMKNVTLEMTVRLLAEGIPKDAVKRLIQEASNNPRLVRREAGLAKLHHGEILRGTEAERSASLRTILSCDPSLACWISGGWSPASHHLFPIIQKSLIWTSTLALNQRRLPASLVRHVLEYAFGSDWDVVRCLEALPDGAGFLDEKDSSVLLNSGTTLPLESQQRLLQSCEENAARMTLREPRIMSALEYCIGRKTAPRGFEFEVIVSARTASVMSVTVSARNTVSPVETPILYALASGHVVHQEGEYMQYPGRPRILRVNKDAAKMRNWLPFEALGRFRSFESKNLRLRLKAANSMSKVLLLRHRNPLLYWDVSMGQVLSVSATETHRRFVGLLMEATISREDSSLEEIHTQEEASLA